MTTTGALPLDLRGYRYPPLEWWYTERDRQIARWHADIRQSSKGGVLDRGVDPANHGVDLHMIGVMCEFALFHVLGPECSEPYSAIDLRTGDNGRDLVYRGVTIAVTGSTRPRANLVRRHIEKLEGVDLMALCEWREALGVVLVTGVMRTKRYLELVVSDPAKMPIPSGYFLSREHLGDPARLFDIPRP